MNQWNNKNFSFPYVHRFLSDWYTCSNWICLLVVAPENRNLKIKEPKNQTKARNFVFTDTFNRVLRKLASWDRVIQKMVVFFLANLERHQGMLNSHAEKPIPRRRRFHGGEPHSERKPSSFCSSFCGILVAISLRGSPRRSLIQRIDALRLKKIRLSMKKRRKTKGRWFFR